MYGIAKCDTKTLQLLHNCVAAFPTQKSLHLHSVTMQNATQTLGIAAQIQNCLADFATLKKG